MSDDDKGQGGKGHDGGDGSIGANDTEYLFVIDEQGRIYALDEQNIRAGKRITSGGVYDMLQDLKKNGAILADLPVYGSCICIALDLSNFGSSLATKREQWAALLQENPKFLDGTFEERKAQWEALLAREKLGGKE